MTIEVGNIKDLEKKLREVVGKIKEHIEGDDNEPCGKVVKEVKLTASERKAFEQMRKAAEVYNQKVDEMRKLSDAIDKKREEMWDSFKEKYDCHSGQVSKDATTLTVYECDHNKEESESPSIEDLLESLSG